jgi:hypothetical protein
MNQQTKVDHLNESEGNISSRISALREKADLLQPDELEPMLGDLSKDSETMFHWDIWGFKQWSQSR